MSELLLRIRFEGYELDRRSLPIYELGTTLIAVQRIINKAALYKEGKLEKGVHLPPKKRMSLALQVARHGKGSDVWDLATYLQDPTLGPIYQGVVMTAFTALGTYVGHALWRATQHSENVIETDAATQADSQPLAISMYHDVRQITERIGNIGGVERITLDDRVNRERLTLDADTRDYVREIGSTLIPGNRTTISGVVTRLLPQSRRLDIQDAPGHYITVQLEPALFDRVRRLDTMDRELRFEGIPYYRINEPRSGFHIFHAERLIVPRRRRDDS